MVSQTLRTFIAIALPAGVSRKLAAIQQRLLAHGLRLRWVKSGNIHLTLKFLGDIIPADVQEIESAIQIAARGIQPFELTIQGLGIFPGIRRPRVLWSGLGGATECLEQLHRDLENALADRGIAREKRPFKGHLTLARMKGTPDSRQLLSAIEAEGLFEPFQLPVDELVLFQSRLQPSCAVYTPLACFRLGG
jgi:2'-5' RNA ligase